MDVCVKPASETDDMEIIYDKQVGEILIEFFVFNSFKKPLM